MKQIRKIAAAVMMLLLCVCGSAFAENFTEVDRTEMNVAYVDMDSLKDEGSYVTAVSKITIRTPEGRARFKEKSGIDAHYLLLSFAYNKEAKQDQLLSVKAVYGYEITGGEDRAFSEANWRDIPAGSLGEKVYENIMASVK